jgi:hypothetical protein
MKFRDRLDKIEALMDRQRFGDSLVPTLIRIRGGLDSAEPLRATIEGMVVEIETGETADEFEHRAMQIGVEVGADYVIIGNLPADA